MNCTLAGFLIVCFAAGSLSIGNAADRGYGMRFAGLAQPTAIPTIAPSMTPAPTATPTATPLPSLPVAPSDKPGIKSTTPPIAPSLAPSVPTLPDSLWLGAGDSVSVPMAIHAQRPFIQAVLNGHPATFLIDTALAGTVIDLNTGEEGPAYGIISLQIGDLRFPRLQPARMNVRAYTEANMGVQADGVIGQDLLSRYPIALDFPNRALTIFHDSRAATAARPSDAVTLALRVIDGQPALPASLDGQPELWFALGSGAGLDVQLDPSADHAGHYATMEPGLQLRDVALGGESAGRLVRARSLALGPLFFNQPLVAVLNAQRKHPESELAGALGGTMLARLSVLIDETSGDVAIMAPPGATLAPSYDVSGAWLVVRRGAIVVRGVLHGSPAEAAHLHPGDEIISINGLVPATLDFARQLLEGSPGSRVTVAYRRWRIMHHTSLTLRVLI